MRAQAWDVYLPTSGKTDLISEGVGYRWIDTVFFDSDITWSEVRSSLVNHDGYDSRIIVRKA